MFTRNRFTSRTVAMAALLALSAMAANAQSTAETQSLSTASTVIQDVGSPTFNNYEAAEQTITQRGLPVSTPGTVIPTQASADTCESAGKGLAIQGRVFGVVISGGATMVVPCDVRSDMRTAAATGVDPVVVNMIACRNPNLADAYEHAADLRDSVVAGLPAADRAKAPKSFRCPDRLRPLWALEREGKAQQVSSSGRSGDPFIDASGRQWPSNR